MNVSKKMVKEVISRLDVAISNSGYAKLRLAGELLWARNVIVWKLTDYKGWHNFCRLEVKMSNSCISRYLVFAQLINKLKYTNNQCQQIIDALGWFRFGVGIMDLKRKVSVKTFILRYKNFKTIPGSYGAAKDPNGDRLYTFSLPANDADVFDTWLCNYGMSIPDEGPRRNVRDAMIKLVRNKLK